MTNGDINQKADTITNTTPPAPEDRLTRYTKIISTLGFPVVVAGVLLYSQLTVGSASLELLRSIDNKLSQIDQKITMLFATSANKSANK